MIPKEAKDALKRLESLSDDLARIKKAINEQNTLLAQQNLILQSLVDEIKDYKDHMFPVYPVSDWEEIDGDIMHKALVEASNKDV